MKCASSTSSTCEVNERFCCLAVRWMASCSSIGMRNDTGACGGGLGLRLYIGCKTGRTPAGVLGGGGIPEKSGQYAGPTLAVTATLGGTGNGRKQVAVAV